jgi:hypothetical protein
MGMLKNKVKKLGHVIDEIKKKENIRLYYLN